jgi:hypothetical protein
MKDGLVFAVLSVLSYLLKRGKEKSENGGK